MTNNNDQQRLAETRLFEQVARLFSVAFNSALLYGGMHPSTLKNAEPFTAMVQKVLESVRSFSLIIDRESLFIEDVCIDKIINPKRIVQRLDKAGVVSITLEQGILLSGVQELFKLAGDGRNIIPVQKMEQIFVESGLYGVRFNYVQYRKVTTDEKIIDSDAAFISNVKASGARKSDLSSTMQTVSGAALKELETIFSLKQLLENPSSASHGLVKSIDQLSGTKNAADMLSHLRYEVSALSDDQLVPSIDSLLSAIYELKMDLSEAIEVRKAEGKFIGATDPAKEQLDDLTCDVVSRLVKEEYQQGKISVKRLAHIIRRLLPDFSELQRFLPKLKQTLICEGMSLFEYLELVKELSGELESDQVTKVLQEASNSIGLSIDEIVQGIKSDPGDAAKLIVLASEIRKGSGGNDDQLSTLLTEYIENVSTHMAVSSEVKQGQDGSKQLRTIVSKIENQLMERLNHAGVDQEMLDKVQKQLSQRFTSTINNATAKWMVNIVSTDHDTPVSDIGKLLETLIEQESQLTTMRDPLTKELFDKGYTVEQIEQLFTTVTTQMQATKKKDLLPVGILTTNNTLYFLNRELKLRLRYNSIFSTIMISMSAVCTSTERLSPTDQQQELLRSQIIKEVQKKLRDLDLIGFLGTEHDNDILIILPMTGEKGSEFVKRRIAKMLSETQFTLNNSAVTISFHTSAACPEVQKITNLDQLISLIRKKHLVVESTQI